MDVKKTIGVAGIVACVAAIFHYGVKTLEAWMSLETLPEWAVISTLGISIGIYTSVFTIVVTGITIGLAAGTGYYIGRDVDVLAEPRRLVGALLAGSAVGVLVIYVGLMSYLGEALFSSAGFGWAIPVLHLLDYLAAVFEIGLPVTVAMVAGAALRSNEGQSQRSSPNNAPAQFGTATSDGDRYDDADIRSDPG